MSERIVREPTPEEIVQIKRMHNEPDNPDLGPCRCPICDPEFHK
jgi:hypothetical protein